MGFQAAQNGVRRAGAEASFNFEGKLQPAALDAQPAQAQDHAGRAHDNVNPDWLAKLWDSFSPAEEAADLTSSCGIDLASCAPLLGTGLPGIEHTPVQH